MAETITTMLAQPLQLTTSYIGYAADQDSASTTTSTGGLLPQAVILVASTAGFAASGKLIIVSTDGLQVVTYTSVTGGGTPSFNGCTGGTGIISLIASIMQARAITFNPSGSNWYRTFLAPTTGTGATQDSPFETLATFQAVIRGAHSRWFVSQRPDGKVRLRYNGTGSAMIVLPSVVATLLGFSTLAHTLFVGSTGDDYDDSENNPTHTIMSYWREAPKGWNGEFVGMAVSERDDGVVDALGGTYQKMKRTFSLRGHPYTPTDAIAQGYLSATPMYPDEIVDSRWLTPTATPAGSPLPWSVHQFVATSMGKKLGYTLGEFQNLTGGATPAQTYFDEGYWSAKTLASTVNITVPGWSAFNDRTELEVTKTARTLIT